MKKLPALFAVAAMLLAGCASTHMRNIFGSEHGALNPQQIVFIAIPQSAQTEDNQNIGQYVATSIAGKLSARGIEVRVANSPTTLPNNFSHAQNQGAKYLFVPVLTNWEHNATQWSMNPSTFGLRIQIFDVATKTKIRADRIASESSHISFFGTDPKELLSDTLDGYIDELYPQTQS